MENAAVTILTNWERLSWEEIRRRYPDQWVMLADVENEEEDSPVLRSGLVVAHGSRRKAVHAETKWLLAGRELPSASRFTGESKPLPPGVFSVFQLL